MPFGVSNGCDRLQNSKQLSVEIWMLPRHAPFVERAQSGEAITLFRGLLNAVGQKTSCQGFGQVGPVKPANTSFVPEPVFEIEEC